MKIWNWIVNVLRCGKRKVLRTETFRLTTMTYYAPGALVGRKFTDENGNVGAIVANTELTMTVKW